MTPFGSPKRKPLRRSASTASLPTPPRTTHKRKRSTLSQASSVADSDEDAPNLSDGEEVVKRRKFDIHDNDADAFWLGDSSSAQPDVQDSPDEVPLVVRNFQRRAQSSLASPPPSFRQAAAAAMASPPHTPPRPTKSLPIRDSPSNPFLDSPCASDEEVGCDAPPAPNPTATWEEKPTITMVYRGSKREFANPNYDPDTGRSKPINPNSLLDPSHPDFEPDFRMQPRVLFSKRKTKTKKKKAKHPIPQSSVLVVDRPKEAGSSSSKNDAVREVHLPEPLVTAGYALQEESIDRYLASIASATPV